jgi:hypothetical protein
MVENFITQERIIQGEPSLDDYLRSDQIDFSSICSEAYDEYLCDMKDRRVDLRRLGLRLELPNDESLSELDVAERRRVVIATSGASIFTLQGTNDEDLTDIQTFTFTESGTYSFLIFNTFKYYKLVKVSGTVTYSAYMYETTFDYPLLYLMRSKIYYSLYHRNGDDAFKEKAEKYHFDYMKKVADKPASHYYYDENDDGEVSIREASRNTIQRVTIRP